MTLKRAVVFSGIIFIYGCNASRVDFLSQQNSAHIDYHKVRHSLPDADFHVGREEYFRDLDKKEFFELLSNNGNISNVDIRYKEIYEGGTPLTVTALGLIFSGSSLFLIPSYQERKYECQYIVSIKGRHFKTYSYHIATKSVAWLGAPLINIASDNWSDGYSEYWFSNVMNSRFIDDFSEDLPVVKSLIDE